MLSLLLDAMVDKRIVISCILDVFLGTYGTLLGTCTHEGDAQGNVQQKCARMYNLLYSAGNPIYEQLTETLIFQLLQLGN
jgi:hypothetical protein